MTKTEQLHKTKKDDPRKMPKKEYRRFIDFIISTSEGICQICNTRPANDVHHATYKKRDGGRDDRRIILCCRVDHNEIHHGISGTGEELNELAKVKAVENWESFEDRDN